MASLQARLDEFKKVFESGAPPYNASPEATEKMHRATAELKATRTEDRTLKLGDHAPSFKDGMAVAGIQVSLASRQH